MDIPAGLLPPAYLWSAGLLYLSLLLLAGVVSPQEGLAGFANEGMLTVAVLYVVAAGLGLAALLFHFIRWRAANTLSDVDHATLEAHIQINRLLKGEEPDLLPEPGAAGR